MGMKTKKSAVDPHKAVQKIMENDFYASKVRKFTNETFITLITDRDRAIELAKKTVEEFEPENLTDDYVEVVADAMQELAQKVLQERALKKVKTKKKSIN